MDDQTNGPRLEINIEPIQPIYLKNETLIEFRDPRTMQGGRVSFRRIGIKLVVEFQDLDPGVEPTNAVANPVEAANIVAIIDYTMEWLRNLKAVTLPGAWDTARPLGFDGLETLQKARDQLEMENPDG